MPHIALNSAEPGIRGLLRYRRETARPLSELVDVLLRGPGTLTAGERELIAAYVSALSDCRYCASAHSACAAALLPEGTALVEQVRADAGVAAVSARPKALLEIASAVRHGGHAVTLGREHLTILERDGDFSFDIRYFYWQIACVCHTQDHQPRVVNRVAGMMHAYREW
jgi:AhpD family alkylhydroperoxidase